MMDDCSPLDHFRQPINKNVNMKQIENVIKFSTTIWFSNTKSTLLENLKQIVRIYLI